MPIPNYGGKLNSPVIFLFYFIFLRPLSPTQDLISPAPHYCPTLFLTHIPITISPLHVPTRTHHIAQITTTPLLHLCHAATTSIPLSCAVLLLATSLPPPLGSLLPLLLATPLLQHLGLLKPHLLATPLSPPGFLLPLLRAFIRLPCQVPFHQPPVVPVWLLPLATPPAHAILPSFMPLLHLHHLLLAHIINLLSLVATPHRASKALTRPFHTLTPPLFSICCPPTHQTRPEQYYFRQEWSVTHILLLLP